MAARFPDVSFIFSHAGGTAPFLVQRFTYLAQARKDLGARMPQGPIHYLQRFYYDTANASTVYPLSSLSEADLQMIERGNAARLMPKYRS